MPTTAPRPSAFEPPKATSGIRILLADDHLMLRFAGGASSVLPNVLLSLAKGWSTIEIATKRCVSEGTVKAHVKAILQTLGARDRTQAITSGIRRALVRSF